eukprot:1160101-Pelagomonas_calceolata.AAC.2
MSHPSARPYAHPSVHTPPHSSAHPFISFISSPSRCNPQGWTVHLDEGGQEFFHNIDTKQSIYEHPMDAHYRQVGPACSFLWGTHDDIYSKRVGRGKLFKWFDLWGPHGFTQQTSRVCLLLTVGYTGE